MIRSLLAALDRRLPLPYALGGALFAAVALWSLTATPRYRTSALLQVEQQRSSALAEQLASLPGAALLGAASGDGIETQVGILRSRRLADAVMDSLALTVRVADPVGARSRLFSARIVANADGIRRDHEGELTFTREDDGAWSVAVGEMNPETAVPSSVRAGEPFRIGDAELTILTAADPEIDRFAVELVPRFVARQALAKRLEAFRQTAGAQLIALRFEDEDPVLAGDVLTRLLAEHREYVARAASGDAGATAQELRRQLDAQQARLATAEDELRRFQEQSGLVMPEEQGAAQVRRYAELRGTLDALGVERDALARLLVIVEAKSDGGRDAQAYRQLATFPSLISNRGIQDLLLALTTAENDRSELMLVRTAENADVRQLAARIEEIERQLLRIGTQYLQSLDEQIAPTREAIVAIDAEIAKLPAQELRFVRLSRDRAILNEGYLALQKQLRQTELQDALRLDEVRVVDAPSIAHRDEPAFPNHAVNLVLGLVLALTAGGALAFWRSGERVS